MASKPIAWLTGVPKSPPFSIEGRQQAGYLLRLLQDGDTLSMPRSRPMGPLGRRVHELRIKDEKTKATWRIVYRIDADAIVVVEIFDKDDNRTPKRVLTTVRDRLTGYDVAAKRRR